MKYFICLFLLTILFFNSLNGYSESATAYQSNNVDIRSGLSHSAVLSVFQDNKGFLWIGTYDGMNKYDGNFIEQIYFDKMNIQSGIIHSISDCDDNCLWISTFMGLHKYSIENEKIIESFNDYKDPYRLVTNGKQYSFVITSKGTIDKYIISNKKFNEYPFLKIDPSEIMSAFFDENDIMWIFTKSKVYKIYFHDSINQEKLDYDVKEDDFLGDDRAEYVFKDGGNVFYITENGELFEYDYNNRQKKLLKNVSLLTSKYGKVSSIVEFDNSVFISFKSSGLIRLMPEKNYGEEVVDINSGIFCLYKDRNQDILWAGSDGRGLISYTKRYSLFSTTLSSSLPINIRKPLRTLLEDRLGNLWIGTKGDGLIRIADYRNLAERNIPINSVSVFDKSSSLGLTQIFALKENKDLNLIWIGGDEKGLYYYSFEDRLIHKLKTNDDSLLNGIHDIYFEENNVLWLATQRDGIIKVKIENLGYEINAKDIDQIIFNEGEHEIDEFFDIEAADKDNLWFASRGYGVIRYNKNTGNYKQILTNFSSFSMSDDILSICPYSDKVTFFGTSGGMLKIETSKDGSSYVSVYNQRSGLLNEMIHGILTDNTGCLWLSTNKGLTKYNPDNGIFHNYFNYRGLETFEFSDDAYLKSENSDCLLFGGVDGFVKIDLSKDVENNINIPVQFTGLNIGGMRVPINSYIDPKEDSKTIVLKNKQNSFTVNFIAIDYLRGDNIEYSYKLDNYNDEWVNINRVNNAAFENLPSGNYVLKVKYKKDVYDNDSQIYSINIRILPPWYKTTIVLIIFDSLIALIIFICFIIFIRYQKKKALKRMSEMEEKQKTELYEAKMKFFTNITHEFLTPLTLIQGPCDRILNYENADNFVLKYTNLLKVNADKLQSLIQEVINIQRFEELGQYTKNIEELNINKVVESIKYQFSDITDRKNISFNIEAPDTILWNTDSLCLNKIIINLVSNAVKYVNNDGEIRISISVNDENSLLIKVFNTGHGIKSEELKSVFNRFVVLDNFSSKKNDEFRYQNGLGLHICWSMVKLLGGTISVESKENRYACFEVAIPNAQCDPKAKDRCVFDEPVASVTIGGSENDLIGNKGNDVIEMSDNSASGFNNEKPAQSNEQITHKDYNSLISGSNNGSIDNNYSSVNQKPLILLVDDNKEIIFMLTDLLSQKYRIANASNGENALEILKQEMPGLIITDIMMPGSIDGIKLVNIIREDRFFKHLPIIIISAKNGNEDKVNGLNAGADAYFTKPFDFSLLQATTERLIVNMENRKKYFNSSASAFDIDNGTPRHHEDTEFLSKVIDKIDQNMSDGNLDAAFIASEMGYSYQSFYRKFKNVSSVSPGDFIKKRRFAFAAKLLLTTNLSIQEVIYKVGISNRSYFYRDFSKIYGMTPKNYRESNREIDSTILNSDKP